jgi:uncharacterized damage-inducible protein DinB
MTNTETEFLADQIHRSCFGGAWHGPALAELVSDLTDEQFDPRVRDGWHSIREIVLHVTAWQKAALGALRGTSMPSLDQPWDGDWPVSGDSREEVLRQVRSAAGDLVEAVRALPPEKLGETVPGRDGYNFRFLLTGIVQHNIYHAGQVALLRK